MNNRQRINSNHDKSSFSTLFLCVAMVACFLSGPVLGDFVEAQMLVYPAKGQSARTAAKG
jgi:hypothetical protein